MIVETIDVDKISEAGQDRVVLTTDEEMKILGVEAGIASLKEKKKLAKNSGLEGQVVLIEEEIRKLGEEYKFVKNGHLLSDSPEFLAAELSSEDRLALVEFLPTSYTLGNYDFDIIPNEALKTLSECQKLGLFEKYEIRIPEKLKVDPALFGRRGKKCYLLARWAESKLLTVEEIKSRVEKARRLDANTRSHNKLYFVLFGVLALFLFTVFPDSPNLEYGEELLAKGFLSIFISILISITLYLVPSRDSLQGPRQRRKILYEGLLPDSEI